MKNLCRTMMLMVCIQVAPVVYGGEGILDYNRFMTEIEPLITTTTYSSPGPGLMSCFDCHGVSTNPAYAEYPLTRGESRANFIETARQISVTEPDTSNLLLKPLALASGGITHGTILKDGGEQFPTTQDATYQIILTWIQDATRANQGAKITRVENHPNPFRHYTDIVYFLSTAANDAEVTIYTNSGQTLRRYPGTIQVGANRVRWDGRDENNDPIPTGMYFYRVRIEFNDGTVVKNGACIFTP